jgi:hypothetical protein
MKILQWKHQHGPIRKHTVKHERMSKNAVDIIKFRYISKPRWELVCKMMCPDPEERLCIIYKAF